MGQFSHYALQTAVHALLDGDSTLMGMVSGVYDFVPAKTEYPYVTLGDMRATDSSTATETLCRIELVLHVYSRARGRKEASDIMGRLQELLHEAAPDVEEFTCVDMRYLASEIRLERDGLTYHGQMRFAVWLQPET